MNKMIILYSPSTDGFVHQPLFNGSSAFDRATEWAKKFDSPFEVINALDVSNGENTNLIMLLENIDTLLEKNKVDYAIFTWADCPFLNKELTEKIIHYHERYRAEYTFAEGYPYGLAPELIHSGTIKLLINIAKTKGFENAPIERDSIFSLIKTDINSFEIETYISDTDWRYLRLQLCCSNKRNTLACERLFDIAESDIENAEALSNIAEKSSSVQRTLPAFYNIQIFSSTSSQTVYEPSLGNDEMDVEKYQKLIKNIEYFSGDAVVSLSFLGDCTYHKDFLLFVKETLNCQNLSLLIETDGLRLSESLIKDIKTIVGDNPIRSNGQRTLNWIIRLDANNSDTYNHIHLKDASCTDFEKVITTINLLKEVFPHAVYPQMVRMNCNEDDLEGFFRKWTQDGTGELIVQKFDRLSGLLDDERPADLSPAKRYACWHIKRDMNILFDGTVVRCKAAAFAQDKDVAVLGNSFEEELATVWARGDINLVNQLNEKYTGQCGESDEYYTFNF